MFPLIETIIGFCAIMLILSLLVKSLASVVKNHVDFYARNLEDEVSKLVKGTLGQTWEDLRKNTNVSKEAPWVNDIRWERLGEEYLTEENMRWVLEKLSKAVRSPILIDDALENLKERLEVHKANIRFLFEKRMKNITLMVGLVLCLGLNINAFTIWQTLYTRQELRSVFSGPYAENALVLFEESQEGSEAARPPSPPVESGAPANKSEEKRQKEKEKLEKRKKEVVAQVQRFTQDVSFGVGKIWAEQFVEKDSTGKPNSKDGQSQSELLLFEFFGSLLTGILVSIGAPYWHDLLRALTNLRQPKRNPKPPTP